MNDLPAFHCISLSWSLWFIMFIDVKDLASDFQKKGCLEDAAQAWEVAMGRSAQDEDWLLGSKGAQQSVTPQGRLITKPILKTVVPCWQLLVRIGTYNLGQLGRLTGFYMLYFNGILGHGKESSRTDIQIETYRNSFHLASSWNFCCWSWFLWSIL